MTQVFLILWTDIFIWCELEVLSPLIMLNDVCLPRFLPPSIKELVEYWILLDKQISFYPVDWRYLTVRSLCAVIVHICVLWLSTFVCCDYPHLCAVIVQICVLWLSTFVCCDYPHLCAVIVQICVLWLSTFVCCDCPHLCAVIVNICVLWLSTFECCDCPHLCAVIAHICVLWLSTFVCCDCPHLCAQNWQLYATHILIHPGTFFGVRECALFKKKM
jgi:hypothetical protein